MELFQIEDTGRLFISPAIEEWYPVASFEIDTIIDLGAGLDTFAYRNPYPHPHPALCVFEVDHQATQA